MNLLTLEDFEYHAQIASVLNGIALNELSFSPMFVFLITWAEKANHLSESVLTCSQFMESFKKLKAEQVSFEQFVINTLDGKLKESMFKDDSVNFIRDYIEFDGYVEDITNTFNTNLGVMPHNFNQFGELYSLINCSFYNYHVNKLKYPDLVIFEESDA